MGLKCTARLIEIAGAKPVHALIRFNTGLINRIARVNKRTFGYRRNRIMLKMIITLVGVNRSLGDLFFFLTRLQYRVNRVTRTPEVKRAARRVVEHPASRQHTEYLVLSRTYPIIILRVW